MTYEIGKILIKKGQYKKAILVFDKLIKNKPNDLRANFLLGKIYYELNDLKKSLFFYNKCNQIQPETPNVLFNLAVVLQGVGEIEKSKNAYLKLILINPNDVKSYYGLFILSIDNISSFHYQKLQSLIKNDKISLFEKSLINYIFSKIEKNKDNLANEIHYLMLSHQQCYNANFNYNNQSNFYYKKIIPNHFNKIKFKGDFEKIKKFNDAKVIFIIGLPRSGSTLVETIISHNSRIIKSVGEFHAINKSVLQQINSIIYSKNFNFENFKFTIDESKFQNSIFEKYESIENITFLDKSLENFFNIDIILNFFPNAKFIHTYRNQNDAIIGIHQKMLSELSWTHNLKDIIEYINNYNNIINHFKKKYPSQIIDVELSDLTHKKEIEAKRILKFCNIEFDDNFLNFYKNENLYNKTSSFLQVRKKIEKYTANKYQPYYYLLEEFINTKAN